MGIVRRDYLGRLISIAGLLGLLALSGCARHTVGKLAKAPVFEDKQVSKCKVGKSQDKPLVVEWPSAERGDLEARSRRGLVVVRYDGCDMTLMPHCMVEDVHYKYEAYTPKRDRIRMRDADELYANIPVGAAKFESKLEQAGELGVDMTLVGKYRTTSAMVKRESLSGRCDGATHVISGLTVGAFEFFASGKAGAKAEGGITSAGAGVKSASSRETLTRDGKQDACGIASSIDEVPPEGCAALLRVEVLPIMGMPAPAKTASAQPPLAPAAQDLPAAPPPAAPEESSGGISTLAIVGYGVGGAGVLAGAITGGIAMSTAGSLNDSCANGVCPESQRADYDSGLAMSHVATTGFIVGGAGLTLGLLSTFVFTADIDVKAKIKTGSLSPVIGPGALGLKGNF